VDLNETIDRVVAGDREQFRHIIKACNLTLYRVAIVILKHEADAEDAMQSTYLKAFLHLSGFRKESSFTTWVTRILINECKMILRSKKSTASLEDSEVKIQHVKADSPIEMMYKKQINHLVEQTILSLPEKYRLVYTFREVNEFSTEETAFALGLTQENVKVQLHRAKTIMKENILRKIPVGELFPFGNHRCDTLTEHVMKSITELSVGSNGRSSQINGTNNHL